MPTDFFGNQIGIDPMDGSAMGVQAPKRTIAEIQEEERRRIEANLARGLDANGNQLPAYGTPQSQGGTAQGYQVQQEGIGTVNTTRGGVKNTSPTSAVQGDYDRVSGQFAPGAGGGLGGDITENGLIAGEGLAEEVLGTQPGVDPNHQVNTSNRDRLTPVIDPNLASSAETERALALSEDLVNRITGAPLQSEILADQMLSNQALMARSARGGAGAVQDAQNQAQAQAPEMLRTAAQMQTQEQVARAGAAGQAASIYAGVATNDANRAERIAQSNQSAGLSVLNNLTTLTGFDYQFDTAKMAAVGQLARDFFNNAAQFAQMDVQLQIAEWNNITNRYGIDKTFKAAMEKIAADEGIGPMDAFKMVLGAGAGVAGFMAAGPAGAVAGTTAASAATR
jgi:hypothetical protein